jgi:hypothetical protein
MRSFGSGSTHRDPLSGKQIWICAEYLEIWICKNRFLKLDFAHNIIALLSGLVLEFRFTLLSKKAVLVSIHFTICKERKICSKMTTLNNTHLKQHSFRSKTKETANRW